MPSVHDPELRHGHKSSRRRFNGQRRRLWWTTLYHPAHRGLVRQAVADLDKTIIPAGSCTCPAGQVTRTIVPAGKRTDRTGRVYRLQAFQFDGAVCGVCPLRSQCIAAQGSKGRRVLIHPQEGMLQQPPHSSFRWIGAYGNIQARPDKLLSEGKTRPSWPGF